MKIVEHLQEDYNSDLEIERKEKQAYLQEGKRVIFF